MRRLVRVHRHLTGDAVLEDVLQLGVVVVVFRKRRVVVVVAEAELRRVRPGNVRGGSLHDVRKSGMPRPVGPTVIDSRKGAAILLHRNKRRIERILLTAAPPEVSPELSVGLEQQARGDRRGPAHLSEIARVVFVRRAPLGRANHRPEAKARTVAALDAVQARVLDARPDVDLVARRRLPGQPQRPVFPRAVVDRLLALVRVVGPFRGIARVLVDKHAGDTLPADLVAIRAEEPQLVTDDRAAERRIDVPQLLDRVRCRKPLGLHVRREVVALERAAEPR